MKRKSLTPIQKENLKATIKSLEAVKRCEVLLELTEEMAKLLNLILVEFQSDPMSMQCFDSRIVERVRLAVYMARNLKVAA